MAVTYSQDLRDRVLGAYDRGMRTKEVAETFNVSPAWARRVKQRRRELGRTAALPRGGARLVKIDMDRLASLVSEHPDATLGELKARLNVECCETAICRALGRLNLTFKKRRSMLRSRTDRTSRNDVATGEPVKADRMRVD